MWVLGLVLLVGGSTATVTTCRFTIDNIVTGVWYEGAPLAIGGGNATDWTQVKTIQFVEQGAGSIASLFSSPLTLALFAFLSFSFFPILETLNFMLQCGIH